MYKYLRIYYHLLLERNRIFSEVCIFNTFFLLLLEHHVSCQRRLELMFCIKTSNINNSKSPTVVVLISELREVNQ